MREARELTNTEKVLYRRHGTYVEQGLTPERAAATLQRQVLLQAPATQVDEGFWSWLGS